MPVLRGPLPLKIHSLVEGWRGQFRPFDMLYKRRSVNENWTPQPGRQTGNSDTVRPFNRFPTPNHERYCFLRYEKRLASQCGVRINDASVVIEVRRQLSKLRIV